MCYRLVRLALEATDLTLTETLILVVIADVINNDVGSAYLPIPLIVARSKAHRATVFRALDALRQKGYLEVVKGRSHRNEYKVVEGRSVRRSQSATGSPVRPLKVAVCDPTGRVVRPLHLIKNGLKERSIRTVKKSTYSPAFEAFFRLHPHKGEKQQAFFHAFFHNGERRVRIGIRCTRFDHINACDQSFSFNGADNFRVFFSNSI